MAHGFLAVHIFAGVHGGDGYGRVPVVGSGHDYGVDIVAADHLAVVARSGGVGLNLLRAAEVAVVEIAYGHDPAAGIQGGLHQLEAANTRAYDAQPHGISGRL